MGGAKRFRQTAGLGLADRRRRESHVGKGVGEDAPEPEHHAGAELRIAHQAGDQLAAAAHHLGHQQADLAVLRATIGQ